MLNSSSPTSGRIIGTTVLGGYAAMGLGVPFKWPRRTLFRQANSVLQLQHDKRGSLAD
jgi:hypothetical protein